MHSRAGSFVKQLAPSDLDTLFVLFFRLGMLRKDQDTLNIYAIKTILDKETIHNAIKYRTENDLIQLEENIARQAGALDDCKAFVDADEEFHLCIAKISRNPLMVFLLEAIQVMLRPYRYKNLTTTVCRESYKSHEAIFEAIKAKDEADADRVAVLHTSTRIQRLRDRKEAPHD
jgi:DNA-binding FadR family transcriptional regulator